MHPPAPPYPTCTHFPQDIESLNIASKDTTQSAMDMWTLLFSTGGPQRGRLRGGGGGGGGSAGQLTELCNQLQDFGDYDLVGLQRRATPLAGEGGTCGGVKSEGEGQ